ncbi:S8 family serine peptidase [Mucilaginibacter sabulilitoris]|uniref:S8 family serine peptidase n=1 Tax=Mucilaginibacter sabulilitoris TaxID=1173583 RepID=A0ABZ0TKP7_9SPHI|nr:S8 family serine peptidase [Mucilaginibacter sabulilitoris]WPU93376.1 S8 family serine peptidase [Mucilaginibacter sabulilitoris]
MNKLYTAISVCLLLLCTAAQTFAQQPLVSEDKRAALVSFSNQSRNLYQASRKKALALAANRGWRVQRRSKNGNLISLQGVNNLGFPVYLITHNNAISAATTNTNAVQPGGSLGLSLSGSSTFLNNKLAIWDGGAVYAGHQEFVGKNIINEDAASILDHSTHVAGTMIAKGVYAPAKGMAFNAATLQSYDFDNDIGEMSEAASGLLLSNHSYGDEAGWNFNDADNRWEWFGLPGDSVDYTFGFYDTRAQAWDKIAYNAPYYLIVESAGNSRSVNGPALGETYYGYKSRTDQTIVNKGARKAGISDNGGYDIISTTGNAKNILTVGAINPLPFGPRNRQDVSSAFFSGWGPTDDGRIKPDIVGNGVNVLSVGVDNPTAYLTLSGTSMAAPNITGSLYLLQEYYAQKNGGNFMLAATLKGLVCQTAFDAGNVGPDYVYGWGVLNTKNAAQAITDNGTKSLINEKNLQQGQQQTFNVVASGNNVLAATISWTDPEATATTDGVINSRTPKLINDLDIRISDGTTTYTPWVLNPNSPASPATKGDNFRDNIEQVYIPNTVPGKAYTITVSHKGTLKSGSQPYSLIVTGAGGTAYCASAPLSNADSRINNLKLSNINNTPTAGCKSYSDYTNLTIQLEQAKTYPLTITLGTCGGNFNKAAKVFIDWNGNGIFDNDELAATTSIVNGTGTCTHNIKVPGSVIPGNYSLMRVVLTETSDTASIKACGSYSKGETQDYGVQFLQTSIDAGVVAIVNPGSSGSCSATTPVTIRLKNFGSAPITNIPVTVTITAPDNTKTTYSETYTSTLQPQAEANFTFDQKFNAVAGATYTITGTSNLASDPVSTNNTISATIVINTPAAIGTLSAYYCTDSKQYLLSGTGDGTLLWYQNINDAIPVAAGSPAFTSKAPVNNTFYAGINDFEGSVGPATKSIFTAGGYNQFTPSVNVSTKIPVVIKSARLYIGNAGKITFNVNNANGQTVSTTTIDAKATRANPQAGAQTDDITDPGKVYDLNLQLPAAGDYAISVEFEDNATIFRSNGGVKGYPFKIGDVFSITGNNAVSDDAADTAYYKNFYYYFYDIKVQSSGCKSAGRQAVTLAKPVITQTANTLKSNFATGNQWLLNGNVIKGAIGATYDPLQSGNYQVADTLASGCVAISDVYTYARTVENAGKDTEIGLTTFPVPASSQLNVVFNAKTAGDLKLSLVNPSGQTVYLDEQSIPQGNFSKVIDVTNRLPGVYVLKVLLGQKVYAHKIIINR